MSYEPSDFSTACEEARLSDLADLAILDTPAEPEFDAIVNLAKRLLGCPIALISLVDRDRLWIKARCGIDVDSGPRDTSFCTHTILQDEAMIVEDARHDPRFAFNPFVLGSPHVRFYAGFPLRPGITVSSGSAGAVGSLCVIDTAPRRLSDDEKAVLQMLSGLVESLMRSRALAIAAVQSAGQARQAATLIDRKNRQLRQAERMAAIGSWRLDLTTGGVEWSDEVFAIHGLPVGNQPPVDKALEFYPQDDRARIAALIERSTLHGEPFEFESDLITATGMIRRVRSIGEVELQDGRVVALIGVFQDITDRHRHETRLRQVANTDSLTGLPNRRMFEERLAELADRAVDDRLPFAVLLIDLDGFKSVNDTLGHCAGDRVLRTMAERLQDEAFSCGFVARLGGDEFIMLIDRARDCVGLAGIVQSVLRALRCLAEDGGTRIAVTATVGAALSDGADGGVNLLRDADRALYAAKRAQRGTGRIYGEDAVLHPWGVRGKPHLRAVG